MQARHAGWIAVLLGLLTLASGGRAAAQRPVPDWVQRRAVAAQWAQVLSVSPEWVVLINEKGQQFPVSFAGVDLFVIRWPTTLDRIAPTSLVEVTGPSRGADQILASNMDVYEGAAQALVTPGVLMLTNDGRVLRPIDFLFNDQVYGAMPGLEQPIQGGQIVPNGVTHIVGPLVSARPPRIGVVSGNLIGNALTVLPGTPAGIYIAQITAGSPTLLKSGDLVYFIASQARPDTLVLDQLVVYKTMPIDEFIP